VARDIDIMKVYQSLFTNQDPNSPNSADYTHSFHGESVIVELPPLMPGVVGDIDESGVPGNGRKKVKKSMKKLVASPSAAAASSVDSHAADSSVESAAESATDDAGAAALSTSATASPSSASPNTSPRYVIVFKYGSVVFINVPQSLQSQLIPRIKAHSTKPLATGFEHDDMYGILLDESMRQSASESTNQSADEAMSNAMAKGDDGIIHADYIKLSELDLNNVAVISTVMGQTVALDYYSDIVDQMLDTFTRLNSTVENTGKFSSMERADLFKVVASNNSVFIGLVARLGLLERSDTAWDHSSYGRIEESMRSEFELDDRFKNLEFKLNLIQHNTRFFIEILHNQKSNKLEWIIVFLIAFESGIMILDMSGVGGRVFGFLSDLI
jgi:uncharacterized Rmd1/YagE family protein